MSWFLRPPCAPPRAGLLDILQHIEAGTLSADSALAQVCPPRAANEPTLVARAADAAPPSPAKYCTKLGKPASCVAVLRVASSRARRAVQVRAVTMYEDIDGFAKLDHDRAARTGLPEVVFGQVGPRARTQTAPRSHVV